MADIELVIKIPEHLYSVIKNKECSMVNLLTKAVENGIPLPKGHGRLIDADVMWDSYHSNDYDFYEALDDAPTIIEKDDE